MSRKVDKEEFLNGFTSQLFTALLDEIVFETAQQVHHDVAKSRAPCPTCNTRECGNVHPPVTPLIIPPIRSGTPLPTNSSSSAGTGTNTPTKIDGVLYLNCLKCDRPIASNRYAPHLASCMGLSSRRGAARNGKNKLLDRSASPASEVDQASDDVKSKSKSKTKISDESEFNLKRKRNLSPQLSPNKKQKSVKPSASPASRDTLAHHSSQSGIGSPTKIPSKLRDSGKPSTSPPSRASSTQSASSAFSQSPSLMSLVRAKGTGPPVKRPSPPRPPPLPISYMQDDPGEETGSSTDDDSS